MMSQTFQRTLHLGISLRTL